jgi:uncharacterized protein (DUF2236 family)
MPISVLESAARSVRTLLSGSPTGEPEWVLEIAEPGDAGLFGPDSMVWRVHSYPATLVGGVRALILQTLEPLSLGGVLEHSRFREDPISRLQNTARFVTVTSFASTEMVERECAMVRAIHARVEGVLPDGRTYSASDPVLLRHVHISLVDSFLTSHQQLAPQSLSAEEADRYVEEMNALAPLLGFDSVPLPHSVEELRGMLKPEAFGMEVSDATRETLRYLAWPPLALVQLPAYSVFHRAALCLLPAEVRDALPAPCPPLVPALDIAAGSVLVRTLSVLLGKSPAMLAAETRIRGL